jgi:hypothetical protein
MPTSTIKPPLNGYIHKVSLKQIFLRLLTESDGAERGQPSTESPGLAFGSILEKDEDCKNRPTTTYYYPLLLAESLNKASPGIP